MEKLQHQLDGRMNLITKHLKANTTPAAYSLSGIKLTNPKITLLTTSCATNQSLTTLHLSRKKITDAQGIEIAKMLMDKNTSLLKLELEGNLLENGSAQAFAKVLRMNKTLRVLDLENNNLTNTGQTKEEVKELAAALDENKTLLHLNLANNNMEETIGTEFVIHTDINKTMICFEFGLNDFILSQVLEIQKNLKRNKAAYDAMRLREW